MSAQVTIKSNEFLNIAGLVRQRASLIIRKGAFDIELRAKSAAPVRTGHLKNSIQAEFPNEVSGLVVAHAEYAEHVEFGTRRMRAQPYLVPALEAVKPMIIAALQTILK